MVYPFIRNKMIISCPIWFLIACHFSRGDLPSIILTFPGIDNAMPLKASNSKDCVIIGLTSLMSSTQELITKTIVIIKTK